MHHTSGRIRTGISELFKIETSLLDDRMTCLFNSDFLSLMIVAISFIAFFSNKVRSIAIRPYPLHDDFVLGMGVY